MPRRYELRIVHEEIGLDVTETHYDPGALRAAVDRAAHRMPNERTGPTPGAEGVSWPMHAPTGAHIGCVEAGGKITIGVDGRCHQCGEQVAPSCIG